MTNRNSWHKHQIKKEIKHIGETFYEELISGFGNEFIEEQLNAWMDISVVADRGELFPVHFYAKKQCIAEL